MSFNTIGRGKFLLDHNRVIAKNLDRQIWKFELLDSYFWKFEISWTLIWKFESLIIWKFESLIIWKFESLKFENLKIW